MTGIRALVLLMFLAPAASAATVTVTFTPDSITPDNRPDGAIGFVGTSDGFSYQFSDVYLFGNYLNLHDDSGILTSDIKPTDGSYFTPKSIDTSGYSKIYRSGPGPALTRGDPGFDAWATAGTAPTPTLTFTGLRNGAAVATQSIGANYVLGPSQAMAFSAAFAGIDTLQLSVGIPVPAGTPTDVLNGGAVGANSLWCDEWCAEFFVDNLVAHTNVVPPTASAVPLPASVLLLGTALLGAGALRLRRRA